MTTGINDRRRAGMGRFWDYGHDPYNSSTRYAPPVRMRTDDPLVGQIRAALDACKLGYDRRRTLDLMQARGFGIEVEELQAPR